MDATYEWWVRVLFFLGGVVIGSMMAGLVSVLRLRRQKRRYLEMFDDEPEKEVECFSLTEADLLEILRLAKMAPLSEASEEGCRRFQELLDATIPTADDYNQRLCLGPEEDTHTFKSAADVQAFHDHMEEGTAEQFGNFRQANRAEPEKGDPS